MRGNPIRAAVNKGQVQFGTWVNMVRNPAILPLLDDKDPNMRWAAANLLGKIKAVDAVPCAKLC